MYLKRQCMLCSKVLPVQKFDRNSQICWKCYGFLKKAQDKGIVCVSIRRILK